MYDLQTAMERLLAMESEAVNSLSQYSGVSGVTYYPYQQEKTPYWMNQIASFRIERGGDFGMAEDIETHIYTVQAYFVMAHYTQNVEGANFDDANAVIPAVLDFFADNPLLTSTAYPAGFDLVYSPTTAGAFITGGTGPRVLQNAGVAGGQVALQFTITLPLMEAVEE